MELHIDLPEWVLFVGVCVAVVIVYTVIGATIGAIFSRLGWYGTCGPPVEVIGTFWPCTVVILLLVAAAIAGWWTIFLPARLMWWLIAKEEK